MDDTETRIVSKLVERSKNGQVEMIYVLLCTLEIFELSLRRIERGGLRTRTSQNKLNMRPSCHYVQPAQENQRTKRSRPSSRKCDNKNKGEKEEKARVCKIKKSILTQVTIAFNSNDQ